MKCLNLHTQTLEGSQEKKSYNTILPNIVKIWSQQALENDHTQLYHVLDTVPMGLSVHWRYSAHALSACQTDRTPAPARAYKALLGTQHSTLHPTSLS
jgi:hypothetical protein